MDHFSKAAVCLKVIKWFPFKCRNFPISPNQSHSLRNGITTSNPSHHQLQQYIHFNNDEQPQNQPMEQLMKKTATATTPNSSRPPTGRSADCKNSRNQRIIIYRFFKPAAFSYHEYNSFSYSTMCYGVLIFVCYRMNWRNFPS